MMTSSNGNIFPRYWTFARGIHWWPVNSPHKGQWRGALMLICAWINGWANNRAAVDLRRHRAHCDVTLMYMILMYMVLKYLHETYGFSQYEFFLIISLMDRDTHNITTIANISHHYRSYGLVIIARKHVALDRRAFRNTVFGLDKMSSRSSYIFLELLCVTCRVA